MKHLYIIAAALLSLSNTAVADCSKEYWKATARAHLQERSQLTHEEKTLLEGCINGVGYSNVSGDTKKEYQEILDTFTTLGARDHLVGARVALESVAPVSQPDNNVDTSSSSAY